MEDVVHDTTHVDEWMRGKRTEEALAANAAAHAAINASRAAYARQLWKPLLAGATGAAMVIAAVYVASPKFIPHTVDVDHVVIHDRDVTVDHVVPRDVAVDHIVPHDVMVDHYVPRDVPPTAPMTENDFKGSHDWKTADVKGRIIGNNDQGGFDVTGDDGQVKHWGCLAKTDPTGKAVRDLSGKATCDTTVKSETSGLEGLLAACHPAADDPDLFFCDYLDKDGVERRIPHASTDTAHGPAADGGKS